MTGKKESIEISKLNGRTHSKMLQFFTGVLVFSIIVELNKKESV